MEVNTQTIWRNLGDELFFFILKRLRNEESAREVLQNSFLKIHKNLPQLREKSKVRAWSYQIVRNEIANYQKLVPIVEGDQGSSDSEPWDQGITTDSYCCFEKFIKNLPEKLHLVVEEVYLKGNSQLEAAGNIGISLASTKARIRRAKGILKQNFQDCCNYKLDEQGQLTGEPDCSSCV